MGDAASGADVVLERRGVFKLTKATAQAWTMGQLLYWDNAARNVTSTVGSNKMIGAAYAIAQTADTVGQVMIDGAMR